MIKQKELMIKCMRLKAVLLTGITKLTTGDKLKDENNESIATITNKLVY